MASPSPTDLCWALRIPPGQQWIAPVLHAALERRWEHARQIAIATLGDEALAIELMERAIERTARQLTDQNPKTVDEVCQLLNRHYRVEVQHTRTAQRRIRYVGTTEELEALQSAAGHGQVESQVALASILRETKPAIRAALLMRLGGCESWRDVAAKNGSTPEAMRMSCKREIDRVRKRLGLLSPKQ